MFLVKERALEVAAFSGLGAVMIMLFQQQQKKQNKTKKEKFRICYYL